MNTKIEYLYRDACNYKARQEVILKGMITPDDVQKISGALEPEGDYGYFIPEQIGLPLVRPWAVSMDDHCFCELYPEIAFSFTEEAPTDDRTIHELAQDFDDHGFWNAAKYAPVPDAAEEEEEDDTLPHYTTAEKKISKNSIPLLTEAVIEIVDNIDCNHPCFRSSFEDSRDFNYTISLWAEEFLDWWDAEEEAGKNHIYLDEIWNFVEKKVKAETTHTYRVWYTMSGYVDVEACSEEEAKELARRAEITWDHRSVDFADVTKKN